MGIVICYLYFIAVVMNILTWFRKLSAALDSNKIYQSSIQFSTYHLNIVKRCFVLFLTINCIIEFHDIYLFIVSCFVNWSCANQPSDSKVEKKFPSSYSIGPQCLYVQTAYVDGNIVSILLIFPFQKTAKF